MTNRTLLVVATIVLGAACAHPSQTPVRTTPAPTANRDSASSSASTNSSATSTSAASSSSNSDPAKGRTVGSSTTTVTTIRTTSSIDTSRISAKDVTRRAADVFGDSSVVRADSAADSTADGPTWDIDVHPYETTDRVEHYVRLFSTTAKDRIAARLEKGTRYEPMIRTKMREGGLPEDMYYLALVESGFDPNAYSRAAAVGMWQFMTSTGRDMGLRVDWWVDERRDPVKSTTAAVRFIKDLKEQFGSLYLAAAAYNGGPGRISRGLTRYADDFEGTTGDDLFFALADKDYLRNETREYVPQLIAAALIAKEPERYGMKINQQSPFVYDSVRVGPNTPLAAIGKASNASVAQMQDLNPQILRGMTPPKDSSFVRIPTGAAENFAMAFDSLPKSDRTAFAIVESKKGQSFASIAAKHDISARQLAVYNPSARTLKSGNLAPGQTLWVPTEAVVAAATAAPDPAIEHWGNSSSKSVTTHVVRSGESLSSIAKKYHTTTAAIMKANGMKRAVVFPGQSIVVKSTTKRTMLASSSKSAAGKGKSQSHSVEQAGETRVASKATKSKSSKAAKTTVAKASTKESAHASAKKGVKPPHKSTAVAKSSTKKKSDAIPVATAARLKKPSVEKVSEKAETTKVKKKRQS